MKVAHASPRLAAALSVLVGVLVLGCGGSHTNTDEAPIRAVVSEYGSAVALGDYRKACGLYTREGLANIRRVGKYIGKTCPDFIRKLWSKVEPSRRQGLATTSITSIYVKGDRASAKGNRGRVAYFRKVGGRWLIDDPLGG